MLLTFVSPYKKTLKISFLNLTLDFASIVLKNPTIFTECNDLTILMFTENPLIGRLTSIISGYRIIFQLKFHDSKFTVGCSVHFFSYFA